MGELPAARKTDPSAFRTPNAPSTRTEVVSSANPTLQSDRSYPVPTKRIRHIAHGYCYLCKTTEASGFRSGPDGPATLCRPCHSRYSRFKLTVYLHPGTGAISILSFAGSVPMRVIDFEYGNNPRRTRDYQKPILVQQNDIAPSAPARVSRTNLLSNSSTAIRRPVKIYSSYARETALLMADVEAEEAQLAAKRIDERKGPSSTLDQGTSRTVHPIPQSNLSSATISNANGVSPHMDSPQQAIAHRTTFPLATLDIDDTFGLAKSTPSAEDPQPHRPFARLARRFKRKRKGGSVVNAETKLPSEMETPFGVPTSPERSQPLQLESFLPSMDDPAPTPLTTEPNLKPSVLTSSKLIDTAMNTPSSFPGSISGSEEPVNKAGSTITSTFSPIKNLKSNYPTPSKEPAQTPPDGVADPPNDGNKRTRAGGESNFTHSRVLSLHQHLTSSTSFVTPTAEGRTAKSRVLDQVFPPGIIEYRPAYEPLTACNCQNDKSVLNTSTHNVGSNPPRSANSTAEEGCETKELELIHKRRKTHCQMDQPPHHRSTNCQASSPTRLEFNQARVPECKGSPREFDEDFSEAVNNETFENSADQDDGRRSSAGSDSDCDHGGEGSDWEVEHEKQLESEASVDLMESATDGTSSHSDRARHSTDSTVSSKVTAFGGQSVDRIIEVMANYGNEFRSLQMHSNIRFSQLVDEVMTALGLFEEPKVFYRDDDGDFITLSSQREVMEMFHLAERFQMNPLELRIEDIVSSSRT